MKQLISIFTVAITASFPLLSHAVVGGSKHDLSQTSEQVCVFCHTPHNANTDASAPAPLWNKRVDNIAAFVPYTSPTMNATCDATPNPLSMACLSCHDGTGGGAVNSSNTHSIINTPKATPYGGPNCVKCHTMSDSCQPFPRCGWQIGPNLSNDHPISFTYPAGGSDPEFTTPPNPTKGWSDVKLYNGRVECPTCHDPHDNSKGAFLRKSDANSALCFTCHIK